MSAPRGFARPIAAVAAAAAAVSLALWALGNPSGSTPEGSPAIASRGDVFKPGRNAAVNDFKKTERDGAFDLEVGWRDFRSAGWSVRLSVSILELAEAEAEFGFTETEREASLRPALETLQRDSMAALRSFVVAEIAKSRFRRYIGVVDRGPLSFDLNLEEPPQDVGEAVRKEFRRIAAAMSKEQSRGMKAMEKEVARLNAAFLESRGIRFKGGEMSVAYGLCASRGRGRMRSALEAFRALAPNLGLYDFLALLVAYLQEVPFFKPPLVDGERTILGYWVPSRVLVENGGDCDSKGVALAALWKNFKNSPLVVFKVPEHLFVGLAIPSPATEGTVTIAGLRYTLCEVTGSELMPPGFISAYSRMYLESGRYAYERID